MNLRTCVGGRGRAVSLFILLGLVFACSSSGIDAYAKSAKSQLMDQMKTQFDAAVTRGDANKAREIWAGIDTTFSDKFDRLTARSVIYGGGAISRQNQLQELASTDNVRLEQLALFLSTIDSSNFMGDAPAAATGSLAGTVKGGGNKRLAGAKVIVAGRQSVSGADGSFSFEGLPSGTYDMFVLASGYKLAINNRTISSGTSPSLVLRLTASDSAPLPSQQEAEAQMKEAMAGLAGTGHSTGAAGQETLAGTLVDSASGAPIADADVTLSCQPDGSATAAIKIVMKEVKSDGQGKFVITEIPAGVCDFTVMQTDVTFSNLAEKSDAGEARGYGYSQQFRMTVNATHRHEHTWKIASKGMNVVGTLAGIVVNANDQTPIAGALVVVAGRNVGATSIGERSTKTDANGRFEIHLVPLGDQPLEASKEIFKSTKQTVNIVAGKRAEVTLELKPITTGTVTGVALNAADQQPLARVKITLGTFTTTTDAQGRFTLDDVDMGTVLVGGRKAIFKPTSQSVTVMPAKSVDVTLKLEPITVGTVTGVALNTADHQPLAGVNVTLGTLSMTTDAQGRFKFKDVQAGDAKVEGSKAIFKPASRAVTVMAAKSVDVTLNLEPITVGTVTGVALNAADQKPLAGVKITLGSLSTTTDAQGRFTLLDVQAGKALIGGNKDVFKPASQGVQVLAAKSVDVTLKLEPITVGTVTGVVLNSANQKPLAGATVTVGSKSATTDAEGRFTLSEMGAGPLTIQAGKPVFKPTSQGVQVQAAKSVDVTMKLEPITVGTVTGVVLNAADQKPLSEVKVTLGTLTMTTDAQGRFKLSNVQAGDALVGGRKHAFKAGTAGVKIQAAKSVDVTLTLEPITVGMVTGIVLNAADQKPLAGATITAGDRSTTTDAKGTFTLSDIVAGPLSIQADKPIFKTDSEAVKVIAAEQVSVTLKLAPITTGTVTGVALNAADQKPLPGVKITLGTLSATTDVQGKFKLTGVQAGDMLVGGSKDVFLPGTQGVKVQAAKSVDVTLKLVPITTATIKGIAVDKQTGKPVSGVRVSVSGKDDETGSRGAYMLADVTAGKVSLVARHPDYKLYEQPMKLKAGKVYEQKVELERRREDVKELAAALRQKGTVDLYGIHFDSGKDQFLPSSLSTLEAVSEVIREMPDHVFEVSGHTDSDGQEGYNQGLSERRARTVIKWLVAHGVNAAQLKPRGYGESRPVVSNSTEAGKALNRRVQLKVIK